MHGSRCALSGVSTAFSGGRGIGSVGPAPGRSTPRFSWRISGVAALKGYPAVSSECASHTGARTALRRAWRIWLKERGLSEATP